MQRLERLDGRRGREPRVVVKHSQDPVVEAGNEALGLALQVGIAVGVHDLAKAANFFIVVDLPLSRPVLEMGRVKKMAGEKWGMQHKRTMKKRM